MQNDATKAPENCASMEELRAAIDALDQQLVALLARRQLYIERAAVLKRDRGAVRDDGRIEEVVAKVLAAAMQAGLSGAIAEPVWRTLIEQSIRHELQAFDNK
ncbi:MAG TPA: chorismate mutase [Rhizomicrobium sp.]|jgi:isochorismate pyruvate lyase|nr:chorismate mutase [Rhizomicrobium sp.]